MVTAASQGHNGEELKRLWALSMQLVLRNVYSCFHCNLIQPGGRKVTPTAISALRSRPSAPGWHRHTQTHVCALVLP